MFGGMFGGMVGGMFGGMFGGLFGAMFGGMFQVCRLMRARVHRRYRSIRQLGWAYHSYNDDAIINCFTFTYVMRGVIACRTLIEQLVVLQIVAD